MKKEIKEVKNGIVRVTVADERWYTKEVTDSETGLPAIKFVPSVTWIAGQYPKGVGFYKWLSEKGWDEAEAIKQAAGDKGSKVHKAIEDLIAGNDVPCDAKYTNPSTGQAEELVLEECEAIKSFVEWWKEVKPEPIAREFVVFNDTQNYAGTVDFLCKIEKETYLIDFKTGQNVWPEYELQISAYKHALPANLGEPKLAILQLGYRRNSKAWKFTEMEDKFDLFLAVQKTWFNEHGGEKPSVKDYPLVFSLAPKVKTEETTKDKKSKKNGKSI